MNQEYSLYKDIKQRTGGEIYIGVVGGVRAGKSTFINRFMDLMVLPKIENENEKSRIIDELPLSSAGRTITTIEPKFIPPEAETIKIADDIEVKVRLIDCVGYMVDGAVGHMEGIVERMVKTPWSPDEIPFTKAAEIGTRKVIQEHSTIGIVVTTDGSFGDIPRNNYLSAEEKTILELKSIGKPFIVLVNTIKPFGIEAKSIADEIEQKYDVKALPVNVEQLKKEDITMILEQVMYEFPISEIEFYTPKWMDVMSVNNPLKQEIVSKLKTVMDKLAKVRDLIDNNLDNIFEFDSEYIKRCKFDNIDISNGKATFLLEGDNKYYYELLSNITNEQITGEYQLMQLLTSFAKMKCEYQKVLNAIESVRQKGYGVITPDKEEIKLESPTIIKHSNKYGVKIKTQSPSIHLIKADIETEIAPIVGTQQQAQDLIDYISNAETSKDGIWATNIFGKTVEQLVYDGINNKVAMIGEECQIKLQNTMQKIVNETNGSMIFIII